MSDPVPHAASSALAELLEVSPQVDAAVILERDGGRLLASAPASSDRMADQLGDIAARILTAADQARTELGREPISQVEVATSDGHVFVVADATWIVAAVTAADPTVGLVFYDLKTALRSVREARVEGSDAPTPARAEDAAATSSSNGSVASLVTATADEPEDAEPGNEDDQSKAPGRWRRKKS